MVVNLTKIVRYRPLSKSVKGQSYMQLMAQELNVTERLLMQKFTLFLAMLIRKQVAEAVRTQTIRGKPMRLVYRKLNKKYNDSKPTATKGKFWTNKDFLIKNLKVWQVNSGDVFIGYRSNAVHKATPYSRGKKRVKASNLMVYLEKGTKKIPPRPLFSIIVKNIAKNISFYLKMFHSTIEKGYVKI